MSRGKIALANYTHIGIDFIFVSDIFPNINDEIKNLEWVGTSYKDLRKMPDEVQQRIGYALHLSQIGERGNHTKILKGFGSAGVLEVVENHDGDTYRAVYTVRFADAVYVLHCFQKKSLKGIATPKPDIELIKARLRLVEEIERSL